MGRVKKYPKHQPSELERQFNWAFLKLRQDYRHDFFKLLDDVQDFAYDDRLWVKDVAVTGWRSPKIKQPELTNKLITYFTTKWRITEPANPDLPLKDDVEFRAIRRAVYAINSESDLRSDEFLEDTVRDLTAKILKNKSKNAVDSDESRYVLLLVDLRWAQLQDFRNLAGESKISNTIFKEDEYQRDFSRITSEVVQKIIDNAAALEIGVREACQAYAEIHLKKKKQKLRPSHFRNEVLKHQEYLRKFKNLAPMIPFRFKG